MDKLVKRIPLVLYLLPYLIYIIYLLKLQHGAVDYETFRTIGHTALSGQPIWTGNSYYPLPYVWIFELLYLLPFYIAIPLWHLAPVLVALYASKYDYKVLLLPFLFAHFIGGQTALVGLVSLTLYIRYRKSPYSFLCVAIACLKPQLFLVIVLYATYEYLRHKRYKQIFWLTLTVGSLYLIPEIFSPWVLSWLHNARPLNERALLGFIPRILVILSGQTNLLFYLGLIGITGCFFLLFHTQFDLKMWVLFCCICLPLLHDYDLIMVIPLLSKKDIRVACLVGILEWCVIAFFYNNDHVWMVVTFIPLCLFLYNLKEVRYSNSERRLQWHRAFIE